MAGGGEWEGGRHTGAARARGATKRRKVRTGSEVVCGDEHPAVKGPRFTEHLSHVKGSSTPKLARRCPTGKAERGSKAAFRTWRAFDLWERPRTLSECSQLFSLVSDPTRGARLALLSFARTSGSDKHVPPYERVH
eukprot:357335-Chlamydomonas_euryale.AAC.6